MADAQGVFTRLVALQRLCREHAVGLPQQDDIVEYWSGIGFTMDGVKYVSPIPEVSEILHVPRYTRVPGVLGWMKGIANVRGRLLPIMDLIGYFNRKSGLQEKKRRLLVLDHGDVYSGLVVDDVMGMQHFPVDSYARDSGERDPVISPYTDGSYEREDGTWIVFSPHRLAEDPRFMQVARAG
ncbi:MAG: chemotaxis protein CheW [Pseudomonadota bacterium]